jgi:hypothetical protein
MLSLGQVGAFILVLANSMQGSHLQAALADQLAATFETLKEHYKQNKLHASGDDYQVFEALVENGVENYRRWEQRSLGPWRAAYNPLRALRPQRASRQPFAKLKCDFDEQDFHFDRPFLNPEILSEESLNGQLIRVLYQKFPFVVYHLLILLDPKGHHPQFMTARAHHLIWALTAHVAESIPGFGQAYNSLGAGASVNHLHTHGFVQHEPFAIENRVWQHNGGARFYPVQCHPLKSAEECWSTIEHLHRQNQPYNLLYRAGVCYVIPRPPQIQRELPDWLPDAGWYELCGGFNLVHKGHFEDLNAFDVEAGLLRLRL